MIDGSVVCLNPFEAFEQIYFYWYFHKQGGKHVDYVTNQVTKKLWLILKRKLT